MPPAPRCFVSKRAHRSGRRSLVIRSLSARRQRAISAALRMGRRFIGCECDPEAWAHGRDRLAREARQTRIVLSEVQESLI